MRIICLAGVLIAASAAAGCVAACAAAEGSVAVAPLVAAARRAGLRVLEGAHLALVTDRPLREGDGVEELPAVFDAAFAGWCGHYGLDPASLHDWRACGCLVVDRERFRAAGLLPDGIPDFVNGFCAGNRFWLVDQSNPAYRRHLLLHEGVHAFTLTVRSLATPVWYTEGIAEFLATHRLEPGPDGSARLVLAPIPRQAADVEQLGRIERIREARATGRAPALADVFATPVGAHQDIGAYAASWAAVALLAGHPVHAEPFRALERGPLDASFSARLQAAPGWDDARAARDFDAFTDEIDYGYDFSRSAIDWAAGAPLRAAATVQVAAGRGWQNSGLAVARGARCAVAASGRVGLGRVVDAAGTATPLESEPDGITLRWYRGRPAGRLLVAQWIAAPAEGRPRFEVLGAGAAAELVARADGPLFLKVNEPPGALADDTGGFTVVVRPLP